MILFLTGFYFGGVLATFLGLVGTSIVSEVARDTITSQPLATLLFILFWPIGLVRAILLALIP